ncbi:MAG: lamin tail domain-containing protein, partial [Candidatus Helarchaeota archaeon]|nr:lamin tail domain-containing protein [Candidatus Helarchaeota archaeon]
MYSPFTGETEWVEIFNAGKETVDIKGWMLGDRNKPEGSIIIEDSYPVFLDDYIVIRKDSGLIFDFDGNIRVIIMSKGFPRFNNDEDDVILRNSEGIIIDSLSYESNWGGDRGVSLERINPYKDTNNRDNWGSCVETKGGTPGKENSIYSVITPSKVSINISPNPFSPDNDGIDDYVTISYFLPFNKGYIKIEIYDVSGRLVKRLFNNEPTGSARSVIWDGRNNEGKILPIGIYIIYFEAIQPE